MVSGIHFFRDSDLPFIELKLCNTTELSYKKHAHEEYSLSIVDHGSSSFWYEGKTTEICPKTVVLLPPESMHACNPVQENRWQYKMLYINAKWFRNFMKNRGSRLINTPIIRYASYNIFNMTNQMLVNLSGNASPLEKEASILGVFEQIIRRDQGIDDIDYRRNESKVKVIREYLHSNFLKRVTLDQLEQVSGLNKFNIIHLFKEAFNITPHNYQTSLRINHAKKELRKLRPIIEVALDTGFYDQSHFSKVFKNYVGITPDKYQKSI